MGFLSSLFGGTVSLPAWQNIAPSDAQASAIAGNISQLPQAEKLASGVDTFNEQQITQLLNNIMPGWSGMVGQAGKNIGAELQGQVPSDVQEALQTSAAAKALTGGTGFGTGTIGGNNFVKSLGLTSLGLMNQGETSLQNWSSVIDQMYAPGMFNVTSMFLSPQQEFQDLLQNEMGRVGQENMAAEMAAQPNPVFGGLLGLIAGGAKAGASFAGAGGGQAGLAAIGAM